MKDSDPTLNPHWQLTKEFSFNPFQFLQVIMKHFLKLIKGRKSLIYHGQQSLPPLLSLFFPSFFCTPFPSLSLSIYTQKHLLLATELGAGRHSKRCAFSSNLLQRSSQFSGLCYSTSASFQIHFIHCYVFLSLFYNLIGG